MTQTTNESPDATGSSRRLKLVHSPDIVIRTARSGQAVDYPEISTQWITYSLRAESRSRIKRNFDTWTRLGLFTISTPTHRLPKLN